MTKARELSELGDKITVDGTGVDVTGTVTADGLTVDAGGVLSIGTNNAATTSDISLSGNAVIGAATSLNVTTGDGGFYVRTAATDASAGYSDGKKALLVGGSGTNDISFYEDTGTTPKFFWDASAESLGIGTSSPASVIHAKGSANPSGVYGNVVATFEDSSNDYPAVTFKGTSGELFALRTPGSGGLVFADTSSGSSFDERCRIDSSGNVLVGTTVTEPGAGNTTTGSSRLASGGIRASSSYDTLSVNRNSTNGTIINIRYNGSSVGVIGNNGDTLRIGSDGGGDGYLKLGSLTQDFYEVYSGAIFPTVDDVRDLGIAARRWDDVYATNGTIQTSDRNEKQDIEALSDAEQRVAVAAKGLLRKYRWKDAVAEKGDAARIHFGIIAQDLQAAFEAEGLDAGRYGMFISSTWTDEETGEERTRMGVRYPQLLAFIIAAL